MRALILDTETRETAWLDGLQVGVWRLLLYMCDCMLADAFPGLSWDAGCQRERFLVVAVECDEDEEPVTVAECNVNRPEELQCRFGLLNLEE